MATKTTAFTTSNATDDTNTAGKTTAFPTATATDNTKIATKTTSPQLTRQMMPRRQRRRPQRS